MTGHTARRGFLRGLVSLPLIGGGVTLIGAPTAVAEPCSDLLFERYLAFVVHEHRELLVEHTRRRAVHRATELYRDEGLTMPVGFVESCMRDTREEPYMLWSPKGHEDVRAFVEAASPLSRAALVLSAVGCDWREGGR